MTKATLSSPFQLSQSFCLKNTKFTLRMRRKVMVKVILSISPATFTYIFEASQCNLFNLIVSSIFKISPLWWRNFFWMTKSSGWTFSGWSIMWSVKLTASLIEHVSRLNCKCFLWRLHFICLTKQQLSPPLKTNLLWRLPR